MAFLAMLSTLTSCTKTIYTAQQNMERFRTKQEIVNSFGLPTEKRSGEGIEEWLYNYGTVYTKSGFGNSYTNASVYGGNNSTFGNSNTISTSVSQFTQYNKYLKLTFDDRGNVLKWESNVDLSVKEKSTGKSILLIVGGFALGVALAIVSSGGN